MFLFVCLLVLLAPVTSDPIHTQAQLIQGQQSQLTNQAPGQDGGDSQAETKEIGTQTDGSPSKVSIKAGHYSVLLDQEVLDIITNFFNKVDVNVDDVLDSSEMADQWEQLDVDSNGVLSSEEVHGNMAWFILYALDVDGDGIATNLEFERATKSIDLNGNGKVELDEFIVMTGLIRNQNKDSHNTYRR